MNSLLNFSDSYKKQIAAILISICLLLGSLGVISFYKSVVQLPGQIVNWILPQSNSIADIQDIVIGGLQEKDILTTAQISNRSTIKASNKQKIAGILIGQTNLIYEGVGNVEAGINVSDITIEEDSETHKIYINLPSAYLKNIYLDIHKSGIVDTYKKGFGANVEQELQDIAQREALIAIKAEACSTNIIDKANKHAKELVEMLTSQYDNIVVTVAPASKYSCKLRIRS